MRTKEKPSLAASTAARLNEYKSHFINNTEKQDSQQKTRITAQTERRALQALLDKPSGIISYDLRNIVRVMNIADVVQCLRRKGLLIDCELEELEIIDGEHRKIGRYKISPEARQKAAKMLEAA